MITPHEHLQALWNLASDVVDQQPDALNRLHDWLVNQFECCDECGHAIPETEASMTNPYHAGSCSLYEVKVREQETTNQDRP